MSGYETNPIFFNKKNKDWTSRTLATPPSPTILRPIKSRFCLIPPATFKVDVICVSRKEPVIATFTKRFKKATLRMFYR